MQQLLSRSPQLWLPLMAIGIGYAILGHTLADLFRDRFFALWQALLLWLGVTMLGTLAIPVGLGGLIGAVVAVAIVFWQLGWGLALWTTAIAIVIMALGLQATDPEDEQAALAPVQIYEYIGVALTVAIAIALALAINQQFAPRLAATITGAICGAIVVIGPQVKDLGISAGDRFKLMGITVAAGFLIGLLHGLITYQYAIPS
jgi:hypothetical protein